MIDDVRDISFCLGLAFTPVNVYSKYIIIVIININPRRARKLHVIELRVISLDFIS